MFIALEVSYEVLEKLVPIETRIRRRSLNLAKQLAKASESVSLNLSEGSDRQDGDKRRHYEMAAGSAREVTGALRIALVKQYITREDVAVVEQPLDRLRGLLWGLTH